jgi:hypothetical protein
MARPKGRDDTLPITVRMGIKMIRELDDLREVMSETRSNVIKHCIRFGIAVLKKKYPGVAEDLSLLRKRKKRN